MLQRGPRRPATLRCSSNLSNRLAKLRDSPDLRSFKTAWPADRGGIEARAIPKLTHQAARLEIKAAHPACSPARNTASAIGAAPHGAALCAPGAPLKFAKSMRKLIPASATSKPADS